MLPIHVALVPSDDADVGTAELLRVAAALQVQLTRDFEPAWEIPAVVSPFLSLSDVPPACLPLVIVPSGTLGPGGHAYHTTEKGTPIGLVEWKDNRAWSLPASHELLEMVCDPQGKRKVMGDSLADLQSDKVVEGNDAYLPQGQVAYLLEICDPCQVQSYTLNGLQVADFVLPRYYAPREAACGCYSFTGNVKGPLQLCDGGYVTWYTSFDDSPVWQAKQDASGTLTIGPMTIPAHGSSRGDVDFTNEVFDGVDSPGPPGSPAAASEAAARHAAQRYGAALRADLKRLLADVDGDPPAVELDHVISILERVVNQPGYYERFSTNPGFRSAELTGQLGRDFAFPHGVPSKPQLTAVYNKVQHATATGQKISAKAAATMMLGQT